MSARSHKVACCDANLVVRLVTDPSATSVRELWRAWRDENASIVAPSLFRYEVTNALHRIALHAGMPERVALELLDSALGLPVQSRDVPRQHRRALALSHQFSLPAAYDAHYLALSETLGCRFYTSDAKLFNAVHPSLQWVTLFE
jgi:predicted nucleic acid-binding protein